MAAITRLQVSTPGTFDQAAGGSTSVSSSWPSPTTAGSTLIAILGISLVAGGSSTFGGGTSAAWGAAVSRVDNAANSGLEIRVIENASSRSGAETFTISGVARDCSLVLVELSACELDAKTASGATGTSSTADTGAVAPSATLDLYRLAVLVNRNSNTQSSPTNSFSEFVEIASPNATAGNKVNMAVHERIHNSNASLGCATTISTSRPWAAEQLVFAATGGAPQNINVGQASSAATAQAHGRSKRRAIGMAW